MADAKDDSLKKAHGASAEKFNSNSEATQDSQSQNDHPASAASKETPKSDAEDATQDVATLKQTVVTLQKKLDDMENRYLRAEADIKNIQNHAKKEQADLIKYDGQQLAHDVLPIVDNLKRALDVEATDESAKQLKKGISMVLEHLNKALVDNGVEEIEALNQPFDPKFQQAVQTTAADDDHPADTVVQVLQAGYRLKDRVLRPAMVIVAK